MKDLDALVATDAIRRLKARFFLAVDGKDWAAYATLFAPDACFEVASAFEDGAVAEGLSDAGEARGGAAMAALVEQALAGATTQHIGFDPVIEVTGPDTATAIWPVEDWLWFREGSIPASLHGFGRYHEHYVRLGGEWRIARLRYERIRIL